MWISTFFWSTWEKHFLISIQNLIFILKLREFFNNCFCIGHWGTSKGTGTVFVQMEDQFYFPTFRVTELQVTIMNCLVFKHLTCKSLDNVHIFSRTLQSHWDEFLFSCRIFLENQSLLTIFLSETGTTSY